MFVVSVQSTLEERFFLYISHCNAVISLKNHITNKLDHVLKGNGVDIPASLQRESWMLKRSFRNWLNVIERDKRYVLNRDCVILSSSSI